MVEHLRAVLRGTEPADGSGHFRAIATHAGSLIVGERGPTRFADGAFRNSLKQTSRYPLLLQHADDRVIGTAEFSEASEGLMMEGRLVLRKGRVRDLRPDEGWGAHGRLDRLRVRPGAPQSRFESN